MDIGNPCRRPALPSHFWDDKPGLLGGRDAAGGGTWLCVGNGRLAFLTNIRRVGRGVHLP